MTVVGGMAQECERETSERELRVALLDRLRRVVPFDSFVWLLTDPETCVGTAPVASVPTMSDLPGLIRLKYATTTNRWTKLPVGSASTLLNATGGRPELSRIWSLLAGYGVADVASIVFSDRFGCWGFLDLWRCAGPFRASEMELISQLPAIVTPALRRRLAATFALEPAKQFPATEPVVLLLADGLEPVTQTPGVEAFLRALLPSEPGRAPVPAAAFNVAAQLLAREEGVDAHPPWARAHLGGGLWITLSAARLATAPPGGPAIAVTIEATGPARRVALFSRVIGLTDREAELLSRLVGGLDTRDVAQRMFLSEHTVQDHLKAIFAKAEVHNRRALVARATGTR